MPDLPIHPLKFVDVHIHVSRHCSFKTQFFNESDELGIRLMCSPNLPASDRACALMVGDRAFYLNTHTTTSIYNAAVDEQLMLGGDDIHAILLYKRSKWPWKRWMDKYKGRNWLTEDHWTHD